MWKEKFLSPHSTMTRLYIIIWTAQLRPFILQAKQGSSEPQKAGLRAEECSLLIQPQQCLKWLPKKDRFPHKGAIYFLLNCAKDSEQIGSVCHLVSQRGLVISWTTALSTREAVPKSPRLQGAPCTVYLDMWHMKVLLCTSSQGQPSAAQRNERNDRNGSLSERL